MNTLPYFTYKNINSLDLQLYIVRKNSYAGAKRDLEFKQIPGRSGDLLLDNHRYQNVIIKYEVAAIKGNLDIAEIAHRVKSHLCSEPGYFDLTDSYDPNYFRKAAYNAAFNLDQALPELGYAVIQYNCKPFKYSFEGARTITLTSEGKLINPEFFPSLPYIKIFGEGNITLVINGKNYIFKAVSDFIEIDSEEMLCYKENENCNYKMFTSDFPVLQKGENCISWLGTVEKLEIIPRWCCL